MASNVTIEEQVISLLKAEGIPLNDKDSCIKSLSECVAHKKCVIAYLKILEKL